MNLIPDETDERILTTEDVVRSSYVVVKPGCYPQRVVLRRRHGEPGGNEYVVHTELLQASRRPEDKAKTVALVHRGFENGDYFSDERKARDRFEERAAKL